MAPPFVVPIAVAYRNPATSQPSFFNNQPREGNRVLAGSINWADYLAQASAVTIDCTQSVNPISQIVAIYIDNLQSDSDAFFLFPDSAFELQIPARTAGYYAVVTQRTNFVISAPLAANSDMLNFQIFNFMPPNVEIAPPYLESATASNLAAIVTGTTAILGGTVNGILTAASIGISGATGGTGGSNAIIILQDGEASPVTLAQAFVTLAAAQVIPPEQLFSLSGLALRFRAGINLVVSTSGGAFVSPGGLSININYR